MRLLSLSLENGVNLIDALTICKDATRNRTFQNFVEKLVTNVSEGKGLGVGFREAKFIPQLIKQMIQTGEESGKLPLVTGRIADYYQKELARKTIHAFKDYRTSDVISNGCVRCIYR